MVHAESTDVIIHLLDQLTGEDDDVRDGAWNQLGTLGVAAVPGLLDAIERAVQEYLVGMDEFELLELWRGMRPLTPDGLPIIGRSQKLKNLIIATGHGMQGLALGPITGQLVSQLACGETPSIDIAGLREERFH